MGFINTYGGALRLLQGMEKGTCIGECRSAWLPIIKRAIASKKNPLKLTITQRKTLKNKIKKLPRKKTLKNNKNNKNK
jgi:hypothetical protein